MIYLRVRPSGTIRAVSVEPFDGCVEYTGALPTDFYQTFGLGKYKFINNQITQVEGWVEPHPVEPI